jgi:hypothetical protein
VISLVLAEASPFFFMITASPGRAPGPKMKLGQVQ